MTELPRVDPPRLAERWLRSRLPPGVLGNAILGDAREELADYVARGGRSPRLWYWCHAIALAARYRWDRDELHETHEATHVGRRGREVEVRTLLGDLRYGARAVRKSPGSAAIAVIVLGLGIGLCAFMFSIIYGVYFRGLDVPDSDRLLVVWATDLERGRTQSSVRIHDWADWRERQSSFTDLAAYYSGTVNLSGTETPRRFQGAFVSANLFGVLQVAPIIGRGFEDGDDGPGAPPSVLLAHQAWRDHFDADPGVVGESVRINGEAGTVLGVMPEGFRFPQNHDLWITMREDIVGTERSQGRTVVVYGRLRDGVSADQASLDMARIASQLEREHPELNEGVGVNLITPVESNTGPQLTMIFGAMMVAVILVLLVGCANVANLLLARATLRTKEAGIRVAMGGSRLRVMLPFLSEALVLALAGAAIGIVITFVGVDWFESVTDPALTGRPYFIQFFVDGPILAFVVGITLVTALAAGLAPALKVSGADVATVLKDESRGSSSLQAGRLSRVLVIGEVALSCALLIGAGLMVKSIVMVGQQEFEYETEGLFTGRLGLFATDYPDESDRVDFWNALRLELQSSPEIASAGLTSGLPSAGGGMLQVALPGTEVEDPDDLPRVNRAIITPGYFEALGVLVTEGRSFDEADGSGDSPVAIVNQPMVDRYFGGRSPIGQQFREGASDTLPPLTVVGVAPDLHFQGTTAAGNPNFEPAGYYVPLGQADARFMSIAARPRGGDPMALTSKVREQAQRLDPDLPLYDVRTLAEGIERSTWFYAVFGSVFIAFGLAALFMATAGLYGVLAFAVSRRVQEVGIRMALGANAGDVVRLITRQAAGQLGIGLAIGLGLALLATRALSLLLFGVEPRDPLVFGGVAMAIVLVGLAAAAMPARRATRVDPVNALRAE